MAQLANRSMVEEKLDSSMDSVNLCDNGGSAFRFVRGEQKHAPVVPSESSTASKGSEQVVGSGKGGESSHEQRQSDVHGNLANREVSEASHP